MGRMFCLYTDTMLIASMALLAITFLVIIGTFLWRRNPPGKKPTGQEFGTQAVTDIAKKFARREQYICLSPVDLVYKEKPSHFDAVIIGNFGLLGVTSLGYNGQIYGATGEDKWLQVAPDGTRSHFANPQKQASADMRALRDVLNRAQLRNVSVEVVYVFSHPKTQLALPRKSDSYTLTSFKKLLRRDKYQEDAKLDIHKAETAIRAANAH